MYPPRFLIEGLTYVNAIFMKQFVSLLKQDQVINVEWQLPRIHKVKEQWEMNIQYVNIKGQKYNFCWKMHTCIKAYLCKLVRRIKGGIFTSISKVDNFSIPLHYFIGEAHVEEYKKIREMICQQFRFITLSMYIKMNIISTQRIGVTAQRICLQPDVKKVLDERCANLPKFDNI